MAAGKGNSRAIQVTAHKHQESRVNIPTEELRGFVAEDEGAPKSLLYPRDPSLDPQLVWKGKDEQDRQPLEVPVVPVYIQEKIHPQAIIEDLRASAKAEKPAAQMDLFADFNGIEDFAAKVDFYHHEQHWTNRMILGDSLLVMTSLAEKEGLKGKVQMIYMDPPYGIKFGSNWQVSTRRRDVKDGNAADLTRQPEQVKAFRDTWELGIHSYLAYLRDRLVVARELLTESGSIFIQIGDENVHLVRSLLDEVFGPENFCSQITVAKTAGQTAELLGGLSDYLLWYAKSKECVKFRRVFLEKSLKSDAAGVYRWLQSDAGFRRRMTAAEVLNHEAIPADLRVFRVDNLTSQRPPGDFPVPLEGASYRPGKGYWKTGELGMRRLLRAGRVVRSGASLAYVRFIDDFPASEIGNLWTDTGTGSFTDAKVYVVQTGSKIIERCLLMTTDPGDLVVDPTCGSGTAAYVAEHWGRRWITTDTSRVALALARTRLMSGRFPYYLLADSFEGTLKDAEVSAGPGIKVQLDANAGGHDLRKGFVYRRVPHITLKSIANNEEIDEIHARWQERLEPVRAQLNSLLKQTWEEWQVPREAQAGWPSGAADLLKQWWDLRRQRQAEIDHSIERRGDTELLYNDPYDDPKRVRVTGPFTVESLSPHRTLSVDEKLSRAEGTSEALPGVKVQVLGPDTFGQTIIENLKKAGIQNTKKNERLKFDNLEPYAGEWIHAAGEFTEANGSVRCVGVTIGPEHGTVGAELVKEAAKEAVKGQGFDLLVICGFAFDAGVYEEARRFGKLTVLMSKMNPDLAMGDALLKKTGAGNLFMVFGEPDIRVERVKDGPDQGKVVLEIQGLDIYDPTTGEIRNSSTDDIACWFVDTDYNQESFFVRHAYFTGAQEPYENLKRALRAEVDEVAWASLYSTRSRPFDPPRSGKVGVKVINHYGDEVMKVFDVRQEKQ